MFGSSRVNKSTKKFAPRAPARRNKDTSSSKDTASPASQSTSNTAAVDNRASPEVSKHPPGEPPQHKHAESVRGHESSSEVVEGLRESDKERQDPTAENAEAQSQNRQENAVPRLSRDTPAATDTLQHDIGESQRVVLDLGTQEADTRATTTQDTTRKEHSASHGQADVPHVPQTDSSTTDDPPVQQLSTPAPTESAVSEVASGDDTAATTRRTKGIEGTQPPTESTHPTDDPAILSAETSAPRESTPPETSRTSRTSKAKRKRTTEEEPAVVSAEGVPPTKKPRKVRKDKGTTRKPKEPTVAPTTPVTEGYTAGTENGPTATPAKRKRASKKRAVSSEQDAGEGDEGEAEVEEDGEEGSQNPKRRRKRKERSPTPEDAEYREVDERTVTLQDLTADRRQGQVSSRERAMREINWEEVARRRRERLHNPPTNDPKKKTNKAGKDKAEGDGEEIEEGDPEEDAEENPEDNADEEEEAEDDDAPFTVGPSTTTGGVTLRMVDGRLVVDETSAYIDRHAAATAPDDLLETVEEDDLTTHITQHSYLHANKRDPADRRPTPNDRWRMEDDEKFYSALAMFGTDFASIARMFPGRTRRNIKHKFTREERQNPDQVRAALVGQVKVELDIQTYLRESDRTEEDLLDPRALAAELDALKAEMQPEIDAARKEHTETERQKRIAEGAGLAGKGEEEAPKKKARKKKRHEPKGGEEVEIIGTIEDGLW